MLPQIFQKSTHRLYIAIAILFLLFLALFYWKSRPTPNTNLVAKIGTLIELPAGEEPTIATVTDKTKLTDQPFFASAQNGDVVLIYTHAKKAYLYRPGSNKILDVAPVNFPTPTVIPAPSPFPAGNDNTGG